MGQFYKGHRIEISVWPDGDSWLLSLFIYYSKGSINILETFPKPGTFKTCGEATNAAFAAGQKWIDMRPSGFPDFTYFVNCLADYLRQSLL